MDAHVRDAIVEQARGVLAERFGTDIARAEAVVESCTNDSTPLPRRLYTGSDEISDAA
jgi:hypothetical protein